MDLYPLPAEQALHRDPAATGWARVVTRGPLTVAEVLSRAKAQMDAEDEAERQAADPLHYIRAHRPRRLIDRLLGRA
jgi:hypothetical protein